MTHQILVLGAGYAGLAAAGRAAHTIRGNGLDARVTLVNAAPDFVERVRLHQVAAGQSVGVHPLTTSLDGTGIDLVVGLVEQVDTERRTVRVRTGREDGTAPLERELGYDTLVHALGSHEGDAGVPGVAEHTHHVATLSGARALERRIREERPRALAVVGGGFTGLEVAAELAESHPDVRIELVTRGRVAADASPRGRSHVRRVLRRLGVAVREHASVCEVDAAGLRLADGSRVRADLVVWNAGFGIAGPAAGTGIEVDADGRAVVDGAQRSVSHPDVLVVGDAAHAPGPRGGALRMSCAMGLPMGWIAADTATARVAGTEPGHTSYGYLFQCVSLGRRDGLIQFVRPDDSPVGFVLTGRLAALYKEYVVSSAYGGLRGGQGRADQYLALVRWSARRLSRRADALTRRRGLRERASSAPSPRSPR
ncbi:NAD(P)/FAD-dependent oxidoreductase [Nocardiopsis sp. SBT366]|uniref:NAD(P)/FAD-dependent oxidoreductase n=1 Tax=Nocardiopsis sp. SBT366 TaxID=1580529 RepID=UPI00066D5F13|nr:FAD-dependent oxidoreductase [Nocardiopsis sp. SBT366]